MKKSQSAMVAMSLVCTIVLGLTGCTKSPESPIEEKNIADIQEFPTLDESISTKIPHLYIEIVNNEEVTSKENYLNAEIRIEGTSQYPALSVTSTRIKGRGNSTWGKPKKPYRLKLDNSASILGLAAAKDWVLLANYNDYTLMTNAIAMKIGKQLSMPYTHDIIAIDLTINGQYRGNYNLTQQVEVHENRVNVGKNGVLWELDSYFDEDWKFKSTYSNLPVMLKDPKVESDEQFKSWETEFNLFDQAASSNKLPNPTFDKMIDKQQLVNFLLVNMLIGNHEINHPKSVFLHKKLGGKYTFGPLWDFDYAFGFSEEEGRTYFNYKDLPVLRNNDERVGSKFFRKLLQDKEIKELFKSTWESYKIHEFENLMQFIEKFASSIRESQKKDFEKWQIGNNKHAQNKADMKSFLRKRTLIMDEFVSKL